MITITLFIVQAHLVELQPAAVLFHLISISGEKPRGREEGGPDDGARDSYPDLHLVTLMENWRKSWRSLEIFSRPFDWFEISGEQLKLAPNVVLKDN